MVSHFHEKRLPRICHDIVTIVFIQNSEDFVLFFDCSWLLYLKPFADFSFVYVWWRAYCFRMQPVKLFIAFFRAFFLVYSFDREFAGGFSSRWRQYLSLFSWTIVLFMDRCLKSKKVSSDLYSFDFWCCFWGFVCLLRLYFCYFYCCIVLLTFSKVVYYDHFQQT